MEKEQCQKCKETMDIEYLHRYSIYQFLCRRCINDFEENC